MRRACFAFLAFLLLTTACAAERPTLADGAAREVEPVESDVANETGEIADDRPVLQLAVTDGWSLDPADAGPASLTNRVIADLLYEGLTTVDASGEPLPALAERWFVSDDRLTWTFVLPETLTDGQGEAITARDVKMSLERIAARGSADQAATALLAVAGWRDRMDGIAGGVAGISAPDPTTLVVRLTSPFELLLEVLASPAFGVTGESDRGLRTTGAFARTDIPFRFDARSESATVSALQLVTNPAGPAAALAAGDADWAVLATGDASSDLNADIIRQPLDLEVAIVARSPQKDVRLGLLDSLEPLLLATTVDGLSARTSPGPSTAGVLPDAVIIDLPDGHLAEMGDAIVSQLEAAGVRVLVASSEPTGFAARVAAGEALLFPIVIAGGTGPAGAALRLSVPGASDDVFGPESDARVELAQAVVTELDREQRALFVNALERALLEDGLLLPIGQFEVRVAIGRRLNGLRHRADGTLDLSGVEFAEP